jgi:universal stress protein E
MACFQNILVGLDLTRCQRFSIDALPVIVHDLFQRAVWLAQHTGARLTFFSALPLPEEEAVLPPEENQRRAEAERGERKVLSALVQQANENGVTATGVFVAGKGWREIIRQVLRGNYDLVLVGTRNFTGLWRMLLGNTALKLFRHCPCPVWVTRPEAFNRALNVLVASDLSPASETALRVAISLGQALDATIHVLHVVEYPLNYPLYLTCLPAKAGPDYHRRTHERAAQTLRDQLEQTDYRTMSRPVQVHLTDGVSHPEESILHFIDEHSIDLLVLGSMSHGGVASMTIGNTAERVLPEVQCSVLAVKPPDFVCQVQLP